jgi:hypothetical protein
MDKTKTYYLKAKLTAAIKGQFIENCEAWGISVSDALRDLTETFIIEQTCSYQVSCDVHNGRQIKLSMFISGNHPVAMIFEMPRIPGWTFQPENKFRVQMFGESNSSAVVFGHWSCVCIAEEGAPPLGRVVHEFTTRFHRIAARMQKLDTACEQPQL